MAKKSVRKKRSIFIVLLMLLNSFFALMIVLALVSTKISPESNYIPAFLGMAYPILLYINIGFCLLWIIMRRKLFLISLIAILVGFNMLPKYFQMNFSRNKSPKDTVTFTLVSYNVQSFRTFYHHGSQEYLDSLTDFLSQLNPDVLCIQEFYNDLELENRDITSRLQQQLNLKYKNIQNRLTRWNRYQFGLAIFSSFPIINSGRILNSNYEDEMNTTNFAVFSDIIIDKDTFRLYNVHLESLRISEEEEFLQMIEDGKSEDFMKESGKLFSKLKNAFVFRANQIKPIREHMDQSPYPVIVCGDFNDTPASWAYKMMSEGLNDAFVQAGRGFGKTYNGKYPSFRIDYIFTAKNIKVHWFDNPHVNFSDHFPVYAVCSLNKEN